MKEKIECKLEELLELLKKDTKIVSFQEKREALLENQNFLKKMKQLQNLDIYSSEYQKLKKELLENPVFKEYKELETEITFFILEINQRLKSLTKRGERVCESSVEHIKEEK